MLTLPNICATCATCATAKVTIRNHQTKRTTLLSLQRPVSLSGSARSLRANARLRSRKPPPAVDPVAIMGRTEAEEVAELKSMFSSPNKRGGNMIQRPAWDSTPLRNRPSALIGLKPVTREPWCVPPSRWTPCHTSLSALANDSHRIRVCMLLPFSGLSTRTSTTGGLRHGTSVFVRFCEA